MTREEAVALAQSLKMNITEDVITNIIEKHEDFMKKIDHLKQIDTDGVLPMSRVDEEETSFMREDVEGETLPVETIVANAPESDGNFISIVKVVK